MSGQVFVLGGGPCGLALAYELSQNKVPVTLIEASDSLGGLAKTVSWGSSSMDLGPHKLFTLDESLMAKVLALRPASDWIEHAKTSRIFMNGHYLNYPPSPLDLWKTFGTWNFLKSCFGMLLAKMTGAFAATTGDTFQDDARSRVGETLYRLFFQPLANKIWGDPARLDASLSRSRIQVPSIRKTLRSLLQPKVKNTWQANSYRYPKGGLSSLWSTMRDAIRQSGGTLILKDPVQTLALDAQLRVTRITLASGAAIEVNPEQDRVFSTLPFARLARMLQPSVSADTLKDVDALELNDLWLIFLKVEGDVLKGNAWIFAPDNTVVFHRVSTQRKFDPGMVEPGMDLVCCEVMNYPGKPTAAMSDEAVTDACVNGLLAMGLLSARAQVRESRIIKLPKSYPVMTKGYQAQQQRLLSQFDRYPNLRTIGRQGAYNYIGTLDAMDTGFGAARWILQHQGDAKQTHWDEERKRTSFYPILD